MRVWVVPVIRWWSRVALLALFLFIGFVPLDRLFFGIVKPVATGLQTQIVLFAWIVALLGAMVFVFTRIRGHRTMVIADRGLILIGSSRYTRTLAWGEIWIPDPGSRRSVLPWVAERERKLGNATWLWRFFCRQRAVWARRFTVYQPPAEGREDPFGREIELAIRELPRAARRAAMVEVYQCWCNATRAPK